MSRYLDIKNYDWMSCLKSTSLLSTRDVTEIFGYKNVSSIKTAVLRKQFPEPIKTIISNGRSRNFWSVQVIKDEIKRRKNIQNV
jgi:hypothetical protein